MSTHKVYGEDQFIICGTHVPTFIFVSMTMTFRKCAKL